MIRRFLTVAVCAIGLTAPAYASDAWRMHSPHVETRPEAKLAATLAGKLEDATKSNVKFDLYHAKSLGLQDADMLRNLKSGVIESSIIYSEYLTRDAAPLAISHVQGVVSNPQTHSKVNPIIGDMYEKTMDKWGIEYIASVQGPFYETAIYCNDPINTLEKLKGKKLRVWAKHQVETFERLGIAAQVIPQNDMYVALQTGVVDCAVYLSEVAHTVSVQEVAKYEAYLHPYIGPPMGFGISRRAWETLSGETKSQLKEAGRLYSKSTLENAISAATDARARSERQAERKAKGFVILEPFSDADRDTFSKAAADAWKDLAEGAGDEGIAVRETVLKVLGK